MQYITCQPAYGRDYKSAKEVKADFAADRDFMIVDMFHPDNGRYVNRKDIAGKDITLNIRFKKNTQICPCRA